MPYPLGSTPLSTNIGTTNSADTFATHLDYLGFGGYRAVATSTDRDLITTDRRTFGMEVILQSDATKWILADAAMGGTNSTLSDNANWIPSGAGAYTFSTGLTNTAGTITSDISTGKSGGQTAYGGTGAGENLTFTSTSHATKGHIIFGNSGFDETNGALGIGTLSPSAALDVVGGSINMTSGGGMTLNNIDWASGGSTNFNLLTHSNWATINIGGASASVALPAATGFNGVPYNWPSSQGASSTFPQNDGSGNITWVAVSGGSGTVTSVDVSGGATGLSFSGGPVTGSGTLTMMGNLSVSSLNSGANANNSTYWNGLGVWANPLTIGQTIGNPVSPYSILYGDAVNDLSQDANFTYDGVKLTTPGVWTSLISDLSGISAIGVANRQYYDSNAVLQLTIGTSGINVANTGFIWAGNAYTFPASSLAGALTNDGSGNLTFELNPSIVASGNLNAQTSAATGVATYTPTDNATWRIGGYITITAVSLDVIQLQVSYTDENSNAQTEIFFPQGLTGAGLSTVGAFTFPTMDIRVLNNTPITVDAVLTTGIGSISYDVGASIQFINN